MKDKKKAGETFGHFTGCYENKQKDRTGYWFDSNRIDMDLNELERTRSR